MSLETKLDEDFIFYLGFVGTYLKRVRDAETQRKCELWLQKLCGEPCAGVDRKRCRNVYLSQLLLCMQSGALSPPFLVPLNQADISDAFQVFELNQIDEEERPVWLQDNDPALAPNPEESSRKGRTYLATRTLPDGQGAFAYVAVSLEDEEPKWLGGGEGVFDRHMEQKYKEQVPEYEMEKILARRKDPKEREKVITFYSVLLQNIEDELDEKIAPGQNETINGLLEQLEQDMRDRGQFGAFEGLEEKALRIELLIVLHDRIKIRISKVMKREELLDEIENNLLNKSLFETSALEADKFQLPSVMWQQVIDKAPNYKNIDKLKTNYPMSVVKKFVQLLSDYKEEIAKRMHRRHENIITQMKKELRREDEKGRKMVDEAQTACEHALEILKAVKEAYNKKEEAEKRNREKMNIPKSAHSKLYDEMRAALYDTQKSVEEEAERGRILAAQIGVVTEQTEICAKVNEESIKKIEEENIQIMKNIKRLNAGISILQKRIDQVQAVNKKDGTQQFDIAF